MQKGITERLFVRFLVGRQIYQRSCEPEAYVMIIFLDMCVCMYNISTNLAFFNRIKKCK